jgi:hypothetical protein
VIKRIVKAYTIFMLYLIINIIVLMLFWLGNYVWTKDMIEVPMGVSVILMIIVYEKYLK